MTDDAPDTSGERTPLTNYEVLSIGHAFVQRWMEIRLADIERDMDTVAAAGSSTEERFNGLLTRAKWNKRIDLMLEAERVFDKRYGTPKGELKLFAETYGDQLNLKTDGIAAGDVKQRLAWYQRRAAIEYAKDVQAVIDRHKVTSPIEQVFLMEWHFLRLNDRFGVTLTPQHEVTVGGTTYRVDFVVTKAGSPTKVAVELDGHNFHEKTREQVRKDKERERAIVRQGFTVLRFAGSEVMKNPRKCVEEVAEILEQAS